MYEDDHKDGDVDCYEEEIAPAWEDCATTADDAGNEECAYFMFRLSSHFLANVQPKLDAFVQKNLDAFIRSSQNMGSSTHSLLQFDIYEEYVRLFEELMEGFLVEYSKDQLIEALARAMRTSELGKETMSTVVLDMIGGLSSFEGLHTIQIHLLLILLLQHSI